MLQKISLVASDLFFMVDNSNYWKSLENNEEEAREELLKTATQFCDLLENYVEEIGIKPEDVVQDFLERV